MSTLSHFPATGQSIMGRKCNHGPRGNWARGFIVLAKCVTAGTDNVRQNYNCIWNTIKIVYTCILLNQQDINVLRERYRNDCRGCSYRDIKFPSSARRKRITLVFIFYCHLCVSLMNVYIRIQLELVSRRPSNTPILQQIYM